MSPSVTSCRTIGDDDYDEKRHGGVVSRTWRAESRAMSCQIFDISLSFSPYLPLLLSSSFDQLQPSRGYLFSCLLSVTIHLAVYSCRRLSVNFYSNRAVGEFLFSSQFAAQIDFLHDNCYFNKPPAKTDTRRCAWFSGSINRRGNFGLIAPPRIRADLRLTNFLTLLKLRSGVIYICIYNTFLRVACSEYATETDPLFPVRKETSG